MNPYYTEPKDKHKPRTLNLEIKSDFLSGIVQNKNKPLSGVCCYFDKPVAAHGDPLKAVGDGINKDDTGSYVGQAAVRGAFTAEFGPCIQTFDCGPGVCVSDTRNGHVVLSCIWTQQGLGSRQGQSVQSSAYLPDDSEALHSSPEITGVVGESNSTGA
jgi:hypothetical protein